MCANVDKLDEIVAVQCSPGNWDYDPYMHGMANGLILAQSIIKDTIGHPMPQYLKAPKKWLRDRRAGEVLDGLEKADK